MQIYTLAQEDPEKCINRVKKSLPALSSAFITRNDEFSLYQEIKNNNRVLINNCWFFWLLLSFLKVALIDEIAILMISAKMPTSGDL